MNYIIIFLDTASTLAATCVAVASPLIAYVAGSLVWRWSRK